MPLKESQSRLNEGQQAFNGAFEKPAQGTCAMWRFVEVMSGHSRPTFFHHRRRFNLTA